MFGRQSVVHQQHLQASAPRQFNGHGAVAVEAAHGEATAVQVQAHGRQGLVLQVGGRDPFDPHARQSLAAVKDIAPAASGVDRQKTATPAQLRCQRQGLIELLLALQIPAY